MGEGFAVLPCNGLDKCAGVVAGELAVRLKETSEVEIICPVLFQEADARYRKQAEEKSLLVIDGCATRCASKLAAAKGLKVARKIIIAEEAKNRGIRLGSSLRLGNGEKQLVEELLNVLSKDERPEEKREDDVVSYPDSFDYEIYTKDKFIFRLPRNGFLFNENDCWVYVVGNRARVGVTDYVQKILSDIIFYIPPAIGAEIDQFGEVGEIESAKAVYEVVSPLSGKVIAVNEELLTNPELINENPYEKGWIAELELSDWEGERDLLLGFDQYLEIMKRKVDEYHV